MRVSFIALLAFACAAISTPLAERWNDMAVKHAWEDVPSGWISQGAAPADQMIDFRLGLKQDKLDDLINSLYEVSDPAHARYGQHLSKEDVDALVRPHTDTVDAVHAWLAHHRIPQEACTRTDAGDWLSITLSVEQAERMLDAKYEVFAHPESGASVVRTLGYSLPRTLHEHVAVITPTTYFSTMRSMRATSFVRAAHAPAVDDGTVIKIPGSDATVPSSCSSTITPACLRALYGTSSYTPAATSTNKLGVAGYLEEYANDADLQSFFKKYRTDATGAKLTHVQVNGGANDQTDPGTEANLDVQYTEGISYPTPNIYYSTGGSPPYTPDEAYPSNDNEPYIDWLNYLLAQSSIPQTITTSYGDDEQTVPLDYATSVCNTFAQLGARGVSLFFSSGDSGVGAGDCESNTGTKAVKFQPAFPAACPYVTAVGGTYKVPEVAISFSGGGFSNYFAQPSYQSAAVANYLKTFTSYSTYFNKTGRAYPDIAAQADNFQVYISGYVNSVAGTSAASPTAAAVISLVNDYRISLGKAPLGFLNPLLYSTLSSGFNDITSGSNPSCGTNGFKTATGWDPVTGFGTPNFTKLQALVKNL